MIYLRNYAYNVFTALSNLLNTAILFGDPDESTSSRLGKAARGDYGPFWDIAATPFQGALDFVIYNVTGLPNHCAASIEDDRGKNGTFGRKDVV